MFGEKTEHKNKCLKFSLKKKNFYSRDWDEHYICVGFNTYMKLQTIE